MSGCKALRARSLVLLLPAILLACISPRAALAGYKSVALDGFQNSAQLVASMHVSQGVSLIGVPGPIVGASTPVLEWDITRTDKYTYASLHGAAPTKCMNFVGKRLTADCTTQAVLHTCTLTHWNCTSQAVTLAIKYRSDGTKMSSAVNDHVTTSHITDWTTKPATTTTTGSYTTEDTQDTYSTTSRCSLTATTANGKTVLAMTISKPTMIVDTSPGPW